MNRIRSDHTREPGEGRLWLQSRLKPTVRYRPNLRHTVRASASRLCDELLSEALFMSLTHVRLEIAAWVEDYNRGRPHSALGYATPVAFAAELN